MRDPVSLHAYRASTAAFEAAAPWLLRRRERRGKEDGSRLGERTGHASRPRPPGLLAWCHGASVGESVALLPLIEAIVARGFHVLLTTGTATSARVMAARLPPGATHQFAPLDLPRAVERFLDHWRPDIVILAESELWPNTLVAVSRRRLQTILVNARLSGRSHRRWRRAPAFIGALLRRLTLVMAQTEGDAARFRGLGAPRVTVAGNLKFDVAPPPADPAELAAWAGAIGPRPVWVAASTHADEEALLLDVRERVSRTVPAVLTLLVPRQPGRGEDLARRAAKRGATVMLKSGGSLPDPRTELVVVDGVGHLGLCYTLASLAVIGRSLAGQGGGQNPIEAAKLGCAVLHGPRVRNFADVYALLDGAGGAREVEGPEALAEAITRLLRDGVALREMSRAAVDIVARQVGVTARIMAGIEPALAVIARRPAASG